MPQFAEKHLHDARLAIIEMQGFCDGIENHLTPLLEAIELRLRCNAFKDLDFFSTKGAEQASPGQRPGEVCVINLEP